MYNKTTYNALNVIVNWYKSTNEFFTNLFKHILILNIWMYLSFDICKNYIVYIYRVLYKNLI